MVSFKIILIFLANNIVYSAEYYVKPENFSTTCPSQPCLTLSEYLKNTTLYFTSGSTFTLLQGQHFLNQTMALSGVTEIALRGTGRNKSLILIDKDGDITLNNCTVFEISSLEILYVGRNETSHTAVTVEESEVQLLDMKFSGDDEILYSQGIRVVHSYVSFVNCSFTKWYSLEGGAVYSDYSNISFSGYTEFTNNTAERFGGGVYTNNSNITFTGTNMFMLNVINYIESDDDFFDLYYYPGGAGLYGAGSNILFCGHTFFNQNNVKNDGFGSAISIACSSLKILNEAVFLENNNSALHGISSHTIIMDGEIVFYESIMTLLSCQFVSTGSIFFLNATLDEDGENVVSVFNSTVKIKGKATFSNNHGAILVSMSRMLFEGETLIINNSNDHDGGAITLDEQSTIECNGNIIFVNNTSQGDGGAIALDQSTLECNGSISFENNTARGKGGAVYAFNSIINTTGNISFVANSALEGAGIALEESPRLSACDGKHSKLILHLPVKMTFEKNKAHLNGGALLFFSYSYEMQCDTNHFDSCFFSIETNTEISSTASLDFVQNEAIAGTVLYGGHVGSCYVELANTYDSLGYFYNLSHINSSTNNYISSNPIKVIICNHDEDYYYEDYKIYTERGKNFTLSVKVLGQGGLVVASAIRAYVKNDSPVESVLVQHSHKTEASCSNITFQLNANASKNTLFLYPDGPCRSKLTEVTVILAPCPPPFYSEEINCICDHHLQKLSDIVKCDNINLLIYRLGNSWIQMELGNNNMTHAVFIYHKDCPKRYCISKNENPPIQSGSNSVLCSSNRIGLLCGACKEGFSLTLNSFDCIECSNHYLSLLLFFGFAGVALIAMLLALHMTVAAGTITGLILYANIVNANSFIFFPKNNTKLPTKTLTAIVSWLNLDLGIETCFYDGLDFYSYAWLQYAFPFYLWFVIGVIVLINKFSTRAGKLFGSNPVAVLATVILMSYTKLLQASILALSYTPLHFSNETTARVVWLHDANITYFHGKHVIICIMAICVIALLLVPYFFLLLLGYRLQAFSRKRAFWWLNRFKPLLDAYYAPYHPKMRFWPGLMLLVRGSLFMVTALSDNSNWTLITIAFAFAGLVFVPWFGHRVYEKLYNDILEGSFILNILLLSIATLYVKLFKGRQDIVIGLSISIALLQFIGIVFFHFCLVLKKSNKVKLIAKLLCKSAAKKPSSISVSQASIQVKSSTTIELREPLLDSTEQ